MTTFWPAVCGICGDLVDATPDRHLWDLLHHVRLFHPDVYDECVAESGWDPLA